MCMCVFALKGICNNNVYICILSGDYTLCIKIITPQQRYHTYFIRIIVVDSCGWFIAVDGMAEEVVKMWSRLGWCKGYSFSKYGDKLCLREIARRVGVSVNGQTKRRWGSSTILWLLMAVGWSRKWLQNVAVKCLRIDQESRWKMVNYAIIVQVQLKYLQHFHLT